MIRSGILSSHFSYWFVPYFLKVVLDGGTRPGDTLQILPLALAQPPNPRSITSHTVLRGHPSLTNRVGFFRGIQWGIHSQKIIIGTAIFFKENMHSRWKILNTHTLYINIYKFIVFIMCNCYMYAYSFIYMYIFFRRIYMCVCVLKLQKNLKTIVIYLHCNKIEPASTSY